MAWRSALRRPASKNTFRCPPCNGQKNNCQLFTPSQKSYWSRRLPVPGRRRHSSVTPTHNASVKMLYLCYNKAVEIAAKNRFPRNVTCKTAHGLAYAVYGSQYKHKQSGNLRLTDIARTINTQDWELAKDIVSTLNAFHGQQGSGAAGRPLCAIPEQPQTDLSPAAVHE
ncbi:Uncharacterized protein ALO73_02970 [Pseudomonas syringae pv. daphniphylli]|uniref:DNA helicase n=1 Tax=Pseudomonas syringae pv. daphniphylli TaxID=264455 RepID=A0A9X0H706_PSESX|nr:Uncharacterized protein ALO73_02970 [Pseudomonas syringae pv. daphniphylli]